MTALLLVAHAPLASSLLAVAQHAFADCTRQLGAVDIAPGSSLPQAEAAIAAAMLQAGADDVLILADAFGATPANAALAVAAAAPPGRQWRVATGVNVPMLWRTLCYGALPVDELLARAVDGGRQGIMQANAPRCQHQAPAGQPTTDDPNANPDQ